MFDALRGRAKKHPQEPSFAHPPVWIHASLAAKCFPGKESPLLISRRREAKRRALLQMLDRIPVRSESQRSSSLKPIERTRPAPDVPLVRTLADAGTRVQK